MCVLSVCPALSDPMDFSLPGSSVHGIFQVRILEWVASFYSRASSLLRNRIHVSCISYIGRWILYYCATWEAIYNSITEVRDIVLETGIKTIPMEKKCRKAKWLSGEALQIAVKRREKQRRKGKI